MSNITLRLKLLRNLDKICVEQTGHLVNAELLKNDEGNKYFFRKGIYGSDLPEWKEWWSKVQKVEIEGEEINLANLSKEDGGDYWQIREALIQEVKQNPSDWKIEEGRYKNGIDETIRQGKNGRRHWKSIGLLREWDEIKALINGSPIEEIPKENQDNSEELKKEIKKLKEQLTKIQKELARMSKELVKLKKENNEEFVQKLTQNQETNQKLIKTTEISSPAEIKEQISKSQDLLKEASAHKVISETNQEVKENNWKYIKYCLYGVGGIGLAIVLAYIYKKYLKN